MHTALPTAPTIDSGVLAAHGVAGSASSAIHALSHDQIIRRNGAVAPFEPVKIAVALMKAFLAAHGTQGAASASVRETVDSLMRTVVRA